jgi:hypothetical protein
MTAPIQTKPETKPENQVGDDEEKRMYGDSFPDADDPDAMPDDPETTALFENSEINPNPSPETAPDQTPEMAVPAAPAPETVPTHPGTPETPPSEGPADPAGPLAVLIASGKIIPNPYPAPADADLAYLAPPLRAYAVDISLLVPDPANVNFHPEQSIQAIKNMLLTFGQYSPCVATLDRVIRIGNGRLEAARQLGWKFLAVYFADISPVQAAALAIGDNRSADFSEWDKQALSLTLGAIEDEGFSLSSIGFTDADVLGIQDEVAEERLAEAKGDKPGDGGDDDDTGGAGAAGGEAPARTGFDLIVPLSESEDKLVKQALSLAKTDFGVPSNSAALTEVCKLYLKTKSAI